MNIETILSAKGSEVRTVRPETVIAEAVRRMRSERVGALVASEDGATIMALMPARRIRHIPVVDGEKRLVGIVSIGDVVKHHLDEIQQEAVSLREYISTPW